MTSPEVQAPGPLFAAGEDDDRSSHAHRLLIGVLGLLLPILLWLIAAWRPTQQVGRWDPLSSVSAYYYSGAVAVFVGILIALGVFLFTYRGYDNESLDRDRATAIIAGGAAVLVAFFPTRATCGLAAPSWWTPIMGTIHLGAATVLFGAFIHFSLFLFPQSGVKAEARQAGKRWRNGIYRVCGWAMVVCVVWAGVAARRDASIFLAEALALEFFAVSWLVKGRVDRTAVAAKQRAQYYRRHPGRLVGDAWSAIRGSRGKRGTGAP